MLDRIHPTHRLRLMEFVCAFAWADRVVAPKERALVERFARALGFGDEEMRQIEHWLAVPPDSRDLDLPDVPLEQRIIFVEAVEAVILADGEISKEEQSLFDRLLSWKPGE